MSHELRTPLNAILGFSEVMKNEVFGSHSTPSYRDYSKDIHGSGQHLLSLINEILDLSRIEAGQYALSEDRIRLADPVGESVALMQARIDAKRHQVRVIVDPALEPIVADGKAVRQILANLISNAVKFTPPGGEIAVKAGWTSRGGQYVSVRDNGPGIPDDELPVVLSSFGRGSLAHSAAEPGAGLGLSIVRGLAELHGGRFILKSRPRHGTEAIVVFPAGRAAEDARAAPDPAAAA
jgi:two-component system cell cycle sensor histidine kinase PleC